MKANRAARVGLLLLWVLLSGLLTTTLRAQECQPPENLPAAREGLYIGKIDFKVNNIFDLQNPHEQTWLHKLGNQLHVQSREHVIRRQLLFKSGEPYDPRLLSETERILRNRRYIKNATVRVTDICDGKVNVEVITWDRWTFTPSVEVGRAGGENSISFDIEEQNLLGLGKYLLYTQETNVDRTTRELRYLDEQLFGSWKSLALSLHNNSDGDGYSLALAQPFYKLDSRQAWRISSSALESDIFRYEAGDISDTFHRDGAAHSISYGWSDGVQDQGIAASYETSVERYRIGWTYLKDRFSTLPLTQGEIAADRRLSYPWASYEHLSNQYIKIKNLTLMDSIDDVALGHSLRLMLGLAPRELGSDDNYVITEIGYTRGLQPTARQLLQLSLLQTTVFGNGPEHDVALIAKGSWHFFKRARRSYVLSAQWASHTHLSRDRQILLGGDSGLRGYPLRYQSGNRKVLLSAEGRHQHDWYPLHLLQFASAAFVDVGSAWYTGNDPEVLADIGIGLRIFPTHASGKTVIHVDLAFPINAPEDISGVQFLVETKQAF